VTVNPIFSSGQTFRLNIYSTYGSQWHESEKNGSTSALLTYFRRGVRAIRMNGKAR
jgi:hypothetical protein